MDCFPDVIQRTTQEISLGIGSKCPGSHLMCLREEIAMFSKTANSKFHCKVDSFVQ